MCLSPGMTRTPTAPAASCCRTPANGRPSSRNRLLSTVAWQVGGKTTYALEGSVFIGGAVVQWLRDGLGIIAKSSDVGALASRCRTTAASTSCRRSRAWARRTGIRTRAERSWDHARHDGRTHRASGGREHRVPGRRLLSAVKTMRHRSAGIARGRRRRANDGLLQFQADLLGVPVVRPQVTETTALGARTSPAWRSASGIRRTTLARHWRSTGASSRHSRIALAGAACASGTRR
jgi:glycerol kinase